MNHDILVMLLGIASSTTLIISALSVHRPRLLAFGITTSVIVAVQYALVNSWVALGTLGVGLAWTTLTLLSLKYKWLQHKLFIPLFMSFHVIAFISLSEWGNMSWVNYIPLIGGLGGVIAISFKEVMYTKGFLLGLGSLWFIYQMNVGLYGQMVGEGLTFIANGVALVTLIKAHRLGIRSEDVPDIDTHFLDVITSTISIPTVTSSFTLPNGVKVPKPVKGAHSQSVEYARRVADYELSKKH